MHNIVQMQLLQFQKQSIIQQSQIIELMHQKTQVSPQEVAQSKLEYYEPTTQPYQYKIFINQCNGYIGSQLVQIFRNDDQIQINPNIIVANTNKEYKTVGDLGVNTVIQTQNKQLFNAILKKSDIIVYSLNKKNARQFEYLVKYLRRTSYSGANPQRLICISSLLTWNGKRGGLQLSPTLDNLSSRNSSQSYLMQLQNLCLDINNLNINIQSFIVCAGMVYGCGEGQLFSYFKRALQQQQSLNIYGNGSNHIPMVHITDLCNMVKDIAFTGCVGNVNRDRLTLPKSRYYFAVDNAKTTQNQLIKCIAKTLGNGNVSQIPIQNAFLSQNFDQMTIDLHVNDLPTLQNWHTIGGFITNIQKIVSQFNLYRGLKPNKIIILGPPAAGKSKVAQLLQKSYGLPVLSVKKVLDQLQNQQSQFANQIKIKLQEIRSIKVQQERKIFQQAKKKKKGKKDAADQFDPSKIVPRLPEEHLIRIFKRRLQKSDCQNKGYILDGWPKTAKSCQALFTNQKGQVQQNILPNSAFNINATQQQVKERIKALPQNIKQGTHWNQEGTARRFQVYTKSNEQGLAKVFLQGKVDIKEVPFQYDGPKQFIQFVQRNGPLGFKKKQKKTQVDVEEKTGKEQQNKKQKQQQGANDENDQNEQNPIQENSNQEFDLQKLTQHQKDILNEKSRPIRQYLIDNVIPQITQGLLQICKQTPRDPIAFLIKFLENKEAIKNKKK